jgi:probable rRNA maturation factor
VEIIIENNQNCVLVDSDLENLIRDTIIHALEYERFNKAVEISVTLVNNEQIREINKEFRDKDSVTDVLSFPMLEFDEEYRVMHEHHIGDYNYDEDVLLLGDIVISLEKAKEQAQEYGHSFEREVGFLTAHSMLHLLGYDHEEPSKAKVMRYKEEQILQKIGLVRE